MHLFFSFFSLIILAKKIIYMRGVNRVMLIGNLGKDPDLQFLEGNIEVAKFSLATNESYKDTNGKLMSK